VGVLIVLGVAFAKDKAWSVTAWALALSVAVLLMGGRLLDDSIRGASTTAGLSIGALFFLGVTGRIVHSILTARSISLDSVFGAICGYLLLGVAFGMTHAMIHTFNPEAFLMNDAIQRQTQQPDGVQNVFTYFSFITLNTVGYGDITPVSTAARTLAWCEALTGQLYLAVLIAGLMGALVARR
jgi:hypothetical protein